MHSHREDVEGKDLRFQKGVMPRASRCLVEGNIYFWFRTVFWAISLAQFLQRLLEADADLSDPEIRPWMKQGKITLEIRWGYSVFYTFLYHLLPPSVRVRRPITRDPWLDSVWPLRFCFLFIPSCLKSATKFLCSAQFTVYDSALLICRLEEGMQSIICLSRAQFGAAKSVEESWFPCDVQALKP